MLTCFSFTVNLNRKKYKLTLLFLFIPLFFFGQTLTGLWTGALSNDSTTIRKDQLFEIALTEYRGKVYGYSRSEFIVNDTLYYTIKRVKGTIEGDVCEVTDDEIIAYNFPGKLDKGIKVTSTFRRNKIDSSWYLAGTWRTNATKKYYAVTGRVDLAEEKDLSASKIFPHLEELKLADDVPFYKERKEGAAIVKIAKPEKIKTEYSFNPDQVSSPVPALASAKQPDIQPAVTRPGPTESTTSTTDVTKEEPQENLPVVKKPENRLTNTETRSVAKAPAPVNPSSSANLVVVKKSVVMVSSPVQQQEKVMAKESGVPVAKTNLPPTQTTQKKEIISQPVTKAVVKQDNPVVSHPTTLTTQKQEQPDKSNKVIVNNDQNNKPETTPAVEKITTPVTTRLSMVTISQPASPVVNKPVEDITKKAASIAGRISEFTQVVNFKSDSLELALYDNGEIDGDTVSVFMNGEVLLSKQGLKASAIKKTIYIEPGKDEEFTLVMFAENLGKYPPNTGLLVVHDGEDIYHLQFSSDLQKSAGIIFKRKK